MQGNERNNVFSGRSRRHSWKACISKRRFADAESAVKMIQTHWHRSGETLDNPSYVNGQKGASFCSPCHMQSTVLRCKCNGSVTHRMGELIKSVLTLMPATITSATPLRERGPPPGLLGRLASCLSSTLTLC